MTPRRCFQSKQFEKSVEKNFLSYHTINFRVLQWQRQSLIQTRISVTGTLKASTRLEICCDPDLQHIVNPVINGISRRTYESIARCSCVAWYCYLPGHERRTVKALAEVDLNLSICTGPEPYAFVKPEKIAPSPVSGGNSRRSSGVLMSEIKTGVKGCVRLYGPFSKICRMNLSPSPRMRVARSTTAIARSLSNLQ